MTLPLFALNHWFATAEMTNIPCQLLAYHALKRTDDLLARNRAMISVNLDRFEAFVASRDKALRLFRPKAGTMAIVEQRTSLTSTEFCERFLDEERVFLVPGKPLGMPDRVPRFGLGRSDFQQGLQRLDRFVRRLEESGETK